MQFSRVCKFSPVVALFALAGPAQALTTAYYWGLQDGSRNDRIFLECTFDSTFPVAFPELCGDETTALLSVVFEHDQPIWDNDASGCEHPEDLDIRCRLTEFDQILGITLSGVAVFDPSEVSRFTALDFLGRCPGDCSETPGPPYITFDAVDALTGLEILVTADEFGFAMELRFLDGRTFEDNFFTDWSEGLTVSEPGSFGLFGLGLAGLGLLLRRGRMGETQRRRREPASGPGVSWAATTLHLAQVGVAGTLTPRRFRDTFDGATCSDQMCGATSSARQRPSIVARGHEARGPSAGELSSL